MLPHKTPCLLGSIEKIYTLMLYWRFFLVLFQTWMLFVSLSTSLASKKAICEYQAHNVPISSLCLMAKARSWITMTCLLFTNPTTFDGKFPKSASKTKLTLE